MNTPLLFLSGAGLPEWIWDAVRGGLDLPSVVAPRPTSESASVTDYARAALKMAPDGPLIVVAHSAGGVVASEVVRLAQTGRVAGILAISAVIPDSGASFTSSLPFPQKLVLPLIMRLAGTRPPESAMRKGLAADLDDPTTRRLIAELTPEPRSYFTSRAGSNTALLATPARCFMVTTEDAELPAPLQRRFAARLDPADTVDLPGGHLPMVTRPGEIIAAITRLRAARPLAT